MDIRQFPSRVMFEVGNLIAGLFEIRRPPIVSEPGPRLNQRTLARLRLCRMQMRHMGILAIGGYAPPPRGESVQQLWNHYGWVPPREGLQLEPARQELEITQEVDIQPQRREVVAIKRRAKG